MMGLDKYKRDEPHDVNPLVSACYWKSVLDDHIDDVLGCSVSSFKERGRSAVSTVKTCACHLNNIARTTGKARVVGSAATIVGSAMSIGGLLAAPFTGGLSLALTLGGAGVATAGGVVNITSALVNLGWEKSDTNRAKQITEDVISSIRRFRELLTLCIHHFQEAGKYIKTEEGKEYVRNLKAVVNNKAVNQTYKKEIARDIGFLVNNVRSFGMAVYSAIGVVEFIASGTYARAGLQTALAIQASSGGVFVNGTYLIMVGSTGAKLLTASTAVLGIGFGIWEAVNAVDAIENGSKIAKDMKDFASNLEETIDELLDIYNKLT